LTAAVREESPAGRKSDPTVSVEKFNVSHDADGGMFRAQFVLRNIGYESRPVSGYTAVILKNGDTPPDNWLTLPSLKLRDGVPTGDNPGQYFSIARFKTVHFSVKSKMDPRRYDTATVYVFNENREILFEKDFPIDRR